MSRAGAVAAAAERQRVRLRIEGTVQGVGFRPFVYRLALELGVAGFVRNDVSGVIVEAEAPEAALARFRARLLDEVPPLARVELLEAVGQPLRGESAFSILPSDGAEEGATRVTPDAATCAACLTELLDPSDRRYRYPFINCTDCGPRFTIVRGVPYDRPRTTMAGFRMCDPCQTEYDDPADRRFHAQPNACAVCGPSVRLLDAAGRVLEPGAGRDAVQAAAGELLGGRIVAIKGLGGYHLACRADDAAAVSRLRARKHREEKPFALMVPTLEAARALVVLGREEELLLRSRERPIVLARRRPGTAVAGEVAPGHHDLGLMLPYSPLHHLLVRDGGVPLVMTSGNVSDEPIAFEDADALERLAAIADFFLVHDRPIETRTDDSVVRVVAVGGARRPLPLRRSRGHVPAALKLPEPAGREILACGAHLKNTFCLARAGRAWVSHHIGDLENYETLESFESGIEHFQRLLAVRPQVAAHDLHPDYLSTTYALERSGLEPMGVQHHHAHLAACLAEFGESGPAVGAIFDGTGYGTDGTIWGGEILVGDLIDFERVGHLWPVRMPGGAAAIREPWRMASAWLEEAGVSSISPPGPLRQKVDDARWQAIRTLLHTGTTSPITTSVGRLCDAAAALCGLRVRVSYEGQAAIELEQCADPRVDGAYPLPVTLDGGRILLDARETIRSLAGEAGAGVPLGTISARFHNALAAATLRACLLAAEQHGLARVVLSGGVFQNVWLLERTAAGLLQAGVRVLVPERLPPNDGGVSFGQAAIAAARSAAAARHAGAGAGPHRD